MRVLLDADVPERLRFDFSLEHTAETVRFRGWKHLANGDLLRQAEEEYDALVTIDRHIPDQQYLSPLNLRVIVLKAWKQGHAASALLMPGIEGALETLQSGEHVFVVDERRIHELERTEDQPVIVVHPGTGEARHFNR